jgi:hypothetical protein
MIRKMARQYVHRGESLKATIQWVWEEIAQIVNRKVDKYTETGPPSTSMTWVVTHGMGSVDVIVQVRDAATGAVTSQDIEVTDENTVTITDGVNMNQDDFIVVVHG